MTTNTNVQTEIETHQANLEYAKGLANNRLQECITVVQTQLEAYLVAEKEAHVRRIIALSKDLEVNPADVLVCVITC